MTADIRRYPATASRHSRSSTTCKATPSAFSRRSKCAFWAAGRGSNSSLLIRDVEVQAAACRYRVDQGL
jgi:hypothetical protein